MLDGLDQAIVPAPVTLLPAPGYVGPFEMALPAGHIVGEVNWPAPSGQIVTPVVEGAAIMVAVTSNLDILSHPDDV